MARFSDSLIVSFFLSVSALLCKAMADESSAMTDISDDTATWSLTLSKCRILPRGLRT